MASRGKQLSVCSSFSLESGGTKSKIGVRRFGLAQTKLSFLPFLLWQLLERGSVVSFAFMSPTEDQKRSLSTTEARAGLESGMATRS